MPPELPEPRPRPLEQIRFSVDEDILGVGYALMWARPDAVTCGIEPVAEELPRGVLDIDWIPRVAAHGWVAITKNHKIRSHPVEARAAVEAEARIVGFAGRSGNMTSWQMMTTLPGTGPRSRTRSRWTRRALGGSAYPATRQGC